MKISRRAITAGTTFFLAAATGHFMQSGTHVTAPPAPQAVAQFLPPVVAPVVAAVSAPKAILPLDTPIVQLSGDLTQAGAGDLPDLPHLDASAFADTRGLSARMRLLNKVQVPSAMPSDADFSAFGLQCGPSAMTVSAAPKAMISVQIAAPCHENQTVTITHAGLDLSLQTDAKGSLLVEIPAFAADGRVSASIGSGEALTGSAQIDGLDRVARMAVVTLTAQAVGLNVYENGADFGGAGHITAEHPRNTKSRRGGQIFALGEAAITSGYRTEVYQYSAKTKSVRMEIAADATAATCGTVVSGRVIALKRGQLDSHDISVTMPDCGDSNGMMVMDVTPAAKVTVASAKKP